MTWSPKSVPSEWDEFESEYEAYVEEPSMSIQVTNITSFRPIRSRQVFVETWLATGAYLDDDRFKQMELQGNEYYFEGDIFRTGK